MPRCPPGKRRQQGWYSCWVFRWQPVAEVEEVTLPAIALHLMAFLRLTRSCTQSTKATVTIIRFSIWRPEPLITGKSLPPTTQVQGRAIPVMSRNSPRKPTDFFKVNRREKFAKPASRRARQVAKKSKKLLGLTPKQVYLCGFAFLSERARGCWRLQSKKEDFFGLLSDFIAKSS